MVALRVRAGVADPASARTRSLHIGRADDKARSDFPQQPRYGQSLIPQILPISLTFSPSHDVHL